jgi:hypothetical protein
MDRRISRLTVEVRSVSEVANASQARLAGLGLAVQNLPIRGLENDVSRLRAEVRSVSDLVQSLPIRSLANDISRLKEEMWSVSDVVKSLPIRGLENDIASLKAEVLSVRASAGPRSGPASDAPLMVSEIQLLVSLPSGKHRFLTAAPGDSVESVGEKLAVTERISIANHWLSFGGHRLDGSRTLASYSIRNNSEIFVITRAIGRVAV